MVCEPAVSGVLNTSLIAWPLTSVTGPPIGVASMLNCTVPVGVVVAGATGLTVAVYVPRVVPATAVVVELACSMTNVFVSLLPV